MFYSMYVLWNFLAGSRNCAACKFDDDDFIEASLLLHTIVLSKELH